MVLSAGERLGPYELVSPLGSGGMGEVWRATDTRLQRDVALKFLPGAFGSNLDRLARFEREARLLASLSHPNIAIVYGLEEVDGQRLLAMELVPGEELAERLKKGPVPVGEALVIAEEIAQAVEEAHEHGVVHRDLKPGNVKLTPDGKVKVLDFGLAKVWSEEGEVAAGSDPAVSESPTLAHPGTMAGVLLGTAAYMSPEQARGKAVDKRADIWSFGVVLYEMLAGKGPFEADTMSDVLVAVLTREPDWRALPAATPARIRDLLKRCLQKSPKSRLHDVADARIEIEEALDAFSRAPAGPPRRRAWSERLLQAAPWSLCALALGFGAWGFLRPRPPAPRPRARLAVHLPESARVRFMAGSSVALSRDGSTLVYAGVPSQLFIRPLDSREAIPIRGCEGGHSPFFSPDGRWIGFFGGGSLKKIPVTGGMATVLSTAATGHGASWGRDGAAEMIVFAPTPFSGLMRVSPDGGPPRKLTTLAPGERSHRWPQVLTGGKAVLFTVYREPGFEGASIAALSLETGERRTLVEGGGYGRYVGAEAGSRAPDYLVWTQGGDLIGAPFDPARLQVTGPPVTFQDGVAHNTTNASAQFAFSDDGSFAYVPGGEWGKEEERPLVWVDREGGARPIGAARRGFGNPRLSPDGRRLAATVGGAAGRDVWVLDPEHDALTRVTFSGNALLPVWTPDGKRLTYCSDTGEARPNLFWIPADGSGPEERLSTSEDGQYPSSWSPDGRTLLFSQLNAVTKGDIWALSLDDRRSRPFVVTPFDESAAMFSPDGRWVSYQSSESGQDEVYVQAFPGPGGKWQVSTEGGSLAVWGRDGRELFYRQGDELMVVGVRTGPSIAFSKPTPLFRGSYERGFFPDVSPDGRRFVMVPAGDRPAPPTRIELVLGPLHERIAGLSGR
ncbi:MAG TPA: protein kinase [Vicinamibacteria bacterium]|nr:protein kinase [Vicinamibacteria bacterium]